MASLLLNILPKRVFDFSNTLVGEEQIVTLAERVDISQYCGGITIVRTHAADLSGGSILVQTVADGYTQDDPTASFQFASGNFSLPVSISSEDVSTVPVVQASGSLGGTGLGGQYAAVVLTASRTDPAPLIATLSVDLLLRNFDEIDESTSTALPKRCGCQRRK
jgi:hypothetical protein